MKIAVLGAGMVGRAIAFDLAKTHDVTSLDASEAALNQLGKLAPHVARRQEDLSAFHNYPTLLAPYDFVVTALPGFMGYRALEAVIRSGKNVADISFFPEDALALDALARSKGVTAITDCGVAPGMSNYILGYYDTVMKITGFECLVGGLPAARIKPYEYKAPFSPIDVIEEYTRPARMMINGTITELPALSDPELIDFEGVGTLEAFNTDGLRSLLFTKSHIKNMKERTLRYPGHIDFIQSLKRGGFFSTDKTTINGVEISPLEFTAKVLTDQWKSAPDEAEFTVMKITMEGGTPDLQRKRITYNLLDRNDPITGLSSMARTTGFTCTASLEMLMQGMFVQKGVFPPELVGCNQSCFEFLMGYLEARGVVYHVSETLMP
jgi:lysine 6-dehydrogenase